MTKATSVLWKASARRLNQITSYNDMFFEYPRGKISFRSNDKNSQDTVNHLTRAIRIRINGHLEKTNDESIFRRMGSLWIHNYAVEELKKVARRIEGIAKYHIYIGNAKKQRVNIIRNKGIAIVYIYKNWINELHNSLLPGIVEALEETERILKTKQNVKTVWKILFTPEIEKKGQKTLDFLLKKGVLHYSLPYVSPKTLDEFVKKHTNIDIRQYYPAQETWNNGIKDLLESFLRKLLGKVKKIVKATSIYAQKWLKRRIIQPYHTTSGQGKEGGVWGGNLEFLSGKPPPEPIYEDPPPLISSLLEVNEVNRTLNIEIPEEPLYVRFIIFKKVAKNGVWRTYPKIYFYKAHQVEEKKPMNLRSSIFKKQFLINLKSYRSKHGLKKALNDCIYALMNYRPRDHRKEALRLKALRSYKKEMLRIS